jgi:hypothetical protein
VTTFLKLGPGAVTDNMFGLISGPALGQGGLVGGVGNATDTPTTACAPTGARLDPDSLHGLNCGDIRFDDVTQRQTIPFGVDGGTNLSAPMVVNEPLDMMSCAAGNTQVLCAADPTRHHSQFENGFVWNPTAVSQNVIVNNANMPRFGIALAPPATVSCTGVSSTRIAVCSSQGLVETTALDASRTTVLSLASSFNNAEVDATGVVNANPTVRWQSKIVQSDMAGTSGGAFTQQIFGSFEYDGSAFSSTQYPNGESFTNHTTTGASLP